MRNYKKSKLVIIIICAIFYMGHSQSLRIELHGGLRTGNLLYVDNYLKVTNKHAFINEYYGSEMALKCIYVMPNHVYIGMGINNSTLKMERTDNFSFLDYNNIVSEINKLTMTKDRFTSSLLVGYEIPKTPIFFEIGGASVLHYNHHLEGKKINKAIFGEFKSNDQSPIISEVNLNEVDYGSSNSYGLSFGGGLRFNFGNIGLIFSYTNLIEQASTPGIKTKFKTKFSNNSYNLGVSYSFTRKDRLKSSDKNDSID